MVGGDASLRPIAAVRSVADAMDGDLGPECDSLTGPQVLFLTTIARAGAASRTDLVRDVRTSRAAIVPGLAVLLEKGFVVEAERGRRRRQEPLGTRRTAAPRWASSSSRIPRISSGGRIGMRQGSPADSCVAIPSLEAASASPASDASTGEEVPPSTHRRTAHTRRACGHPGSRGSAWSTTRPRTMPDA
jgi:hypothetical protein